VFRPHLSESDLYSPWRGTHLHQLASQPHHRQVHWRPHHQNPILNSNLVHPNGRKKRWSTEAVEPGQAEISCNLTTSAAATLGRAEAKWSLEGRLYWESPLQPKDGYIMILYVYDILHINVWRIYIKEGLKDLLLEVIKVAPHKFHNCETFSTFTYIS
jgi:hypothetical protein